MSNEKRGLVNITTGAEIDDLVNEYEIFVSKDGDDSLNNGSKLFPYATLQKGFDEIANVPDQGMTKMHIILHVGPGRWLEEIDWTIPYDWGSGTRGLRLSIEGAGLVAGVNTTYIRSIIIRQHDQAGTAIQIGISGVVIDPESGSPAYGLTYIDHPNRNTGTYINMTNSQIWCWGTGRGSLYIDATTNGAGSGGFSFNAFHCNFRRGSGTDASGQIKIENGGTFNGRSVDFGMYDCHGIVLTGGSSISLIDAEMDMESSDATDYDFINAGAGGSVDIVGLTGVLANNGHIVTKLGTYTGGLDDYMRVTEVMAVTAGGTGGLNAPAGALVAHRNVTNEAGGVIPVTVASPALDLPLINADQINFNPGTEKIGLVPIGGIIPVVCGYFDSNANTNYQNSLLPGVGTEIDEANAYYNPYGFYVCNGDDPADSDSPIWDTANKHLPNITDDRFIMGDTDIGGIGGSNSNTLTVNQIPAHNHGSSGLSMDSQLGNHSHSISGTVASGGSTAHNHGVNGHTHGMNHDHVINAETGNSNTPAINHNHALAEATIPHSGGISVGWTSSSGSTQLYTATLTPGANGYSGGENGSHYHALGLHSHGGNTSGPFMGGSPKTSTDSGNASLQNADISHTHGFSGSSGDYDSSHAHSISGSTDNNTTSGDSVENRPVYLSCLFLIRVK